MFCALAIWLGMPTAEARPPGEQVRPGLTAETKPREVEDIGIKEQLGSTIDLSLPVVNERGDTVPLSHYFDRGKPIILSLVYFGCPGLCNFHLNGVFEGLKQVDWTAGKEFEVIALSFDTKETSELSRGKKKTYMDLYERPQSIDGVHFVTAGVETVTKITQQTGFQFKWNAEANEWAHASAAIVISPEGKISRYLHGIILDPKDLRLAIMDAGQGRVGNFIDQMVWYCFKYDPKKSKYTLYAVRIMQAGGVAIVLILLMLLIPQFWARRAQLERRMNQ